MVNLLTLLIIHTYTCLHVLQYHFLNKRPICFKAHLILTEDDNGTLFILSSLCCSLDIITIQKKSKYGQYKERIYRIADYSESSFTFKTKTMMVWLSFTKLLKQSLKFKTSIALFYERANL